MNFGGEGGLRELGIRNYGLGIRNYGKKRAVFPGRILSC
jgi:hypothetical protein